MSDLVPQRETDQPIGGATELVEGAENFDFDSIIYALGGLFTRGVADGLRPEDQIVEADYRVRPSPLAVVESDASTASH